MESGTWVLPEETYSARIKGSCVCGAVRWSYDAAFSAMVHCHCSRCRKHHGTLFATFVAGPLSTFHWRGGTEKIGTWQSSEQGKRSFCSVCGSKVPAASSQQVFMPAGALDGELGIRPQMHLFVGSKAPWHSIHDGLPQHEEYPREWGAHGLPTEQRAVRAGVHSGSCACGKVRFELGERPFRMHHCHCGRCRHARGGAHATNVIYRLEALRFTEGSKWVTDFDLPGAEFFGTCFCRSCGGALPRRSSKRNAAVVPIGSLDTDPEIHALGHQFVGSKAAWYDISDGVPQFAEGAPGPTAR